MHNIGQNRKKISQPHQTRFFQGILQLKNKEKLLSDINELKELHDFAEIIPISATKNDNVDLLINCIKKQLDDQDTRQILVDPTIVTPLAA